MAISQTLHPTKVRVSPEWWDSVQTNIDDAIDGCNDITSAIAAHQRKGRYTAEELLDLIDGWAREIRKTLEGMQTPI